MCFSLSLSFRKVLSLYRKNAKWLAKKIVDVFAFPNLSLLENNNGGIFVPLYIKTLHQICVTYLSLLERYLEGGYVQRVALSITLGLAKEMCYKEIVKILTSWTGSLRRTTENPGLLLEVFIALESVLNSEDKCNKVSKLGNSSSVQL